MCEEKDRAVPALCRPHHGDAPLDHTGGPYVPLPRLPTDRVRLFRLRTHFKDAVSLANHRRLFGGALRRGVRGAPGCLTILATGLSQPTAVCRPYAV